MCCEIVGCKETLVRAVRLRWVLVRIFVFRPLCRQGWGRPETFFVRYVLIAGGFSVILLPEINGLETICLVWDDF